MVPAAVVSAELAVALVPLALAAVALTAELAVAGA